MIDTSALRGAIAEKGYSQRKLAKMLGVSDNTFYKKMKTGVFNSNEMHAMIELLDIQDPCRIFFAKNVAYGSTIQINT